MIPTKQKAYLKRQKRKRRAALIVLLFLPLAIIGIGGAIYFGSDQKPPTQASVAVETPPATDQSQNDQTPEFPPISETPTRLIIDKIGVDAAIEPVGLTPDGLMDDPDTNEGVGWYDKSAKAGESEFAMLLDGHYGIGNRPGVFRRLLEMQIGDTMKVRGQNGSTLQYQVVELIQQPLDEVDMRRALYPYREGAQSLTIITCDGTYDAAQRTYDKRTVLYAIRTQ